MDSILDELYTLLAPPETPSSREKEETWKEYFSMCDQIHAAFGLKFIDQFTLFRAELAHTDELAAFRRGLRLGIQLMMEAFTPV